MGVSPISCMTPHQNSPVFSGFTSGFVRIYGGRSRPAIMAKGVGGVSSIPIGYSDGPIIPDRQGVPGSSLFLMAHLGNGQYRVYTSLYVYQPEKVQVGGGHDRKRKRPAISFMQTVPSSPGVLTGREFYSAVSHSRAGARSWRREKPKTTKAMTMDASERARTPFE